ncbi:MAG TPA: S41 family peptidase [Bryobacteraceae bacterium]|nr:S41 family peptidase [Bryobacteraceae bacterium]
MATRRRSFIFVPLIVLMCSMLGGLYGPSLVGAPTATSEDDIKASLKSFTKVLNVVEENFADKVSPDKAIYKGAIPGMARTLDPHTSFFDPKDFQLLREDQKGHYYGVGMTVAPRNGKTIVIAPFAGSPAYKAGIRPGDAILEVNDKRTDNLSTTEVADLLKGPRGTPVQVTIAREGAEKPIAFNIIRDEIPRKSVEDAFFVKPGVLYLDIQSFNENTSREMEDNLKRVGENNVKGLILDLRENPGGLLNEGVAVADHFLQKGQTIVSHRGRASADKPYVARHGNGGRDYPIVVLVNRYSASAAEIVAGALQDHDRAWILGDNTFGKGLVQTVYPLSENTGLALTTAHFYTPSGRLIQRDYTNTSFYNYYYRKDVETKNMQDVKMTDSGRTVYGGGGISPDEKFSAPKPNKFQIELLRKYAFFNFTSKYFGTHDTKLSKSWDPDASVMNDLHAFALKEGAQFTEGEWAENADWVKQQLKREMYITAFSVEDSRKLGIEFDPIVLKAIDSMPKAKNLLESAKKLIVQRTQLRKSER